MVKWWVNSWFWQIFFKYENYYSKTILCPPKTIFFRYNERFTIVILPVMMRWRYGSQKHQGKQLLFKGWVTSTTSHDFEKLPIFWDPFRLVNDYDSLGMVGFGWMVEITQPTAKLGRSANLVETQDAQEEEYEMVGIPKWHPPESLLIRPWTRDSIYTSTGTSCHRSWKGHRRSGGIVDEMFKV